MNDVDKRLFADWWMGLAEHNERTHAAFAPYLQKGRLWPVDMSADMLLKLMVKVAALAPPRE